MIIANAGLIGMGAVGSVYSRLLHEKYKDNFLAIACGKRKEKIEHNGITVNNKTFYPKVIDCSIKQTRADWLI